MPELTDQLIDKAKPREKVFFLWDSEVKGLGVKVTPSGGKTFVFQWQQNTPKPSSKRRKIGNCRDLSIAHARDVAKTARQKIHNHVVDQSDAELFSNAETCSSKQAKSNINVGNGSNLGELEAELLHYFDQAGISTRDKIISVATKMFINEGFDISLEAIARKSGYTRLTIYRYFKNKDALTNAVIGEVEARFFETDPHPIDFNASPRVALSTFAAKFRANSLSEEFISFYRLLNNVSREKSLNLFEKVVILSHRRSIKVVSEYFNHLVEKGVFRPLNTEFVAEQFLSSIPGFDRSRLQKGLSIKTVVEEAEYLEQLVDTFLFGVLKDNTRNGSQWAPRGKVAASRGKGAKGNARSN
jgi:AcrR family transcriptional regulator